jgi:FdhD protein
VRPATDTIVVEEPLEVRVDGTAVATVMRTPGSDRNLALGFLLTEGWISTTADVGALSLCVQWQTSRDDADRPSTEEETEENVADLRAPSGVLLRSPRDVPQRLPATSSCGVCGKRTIEEVLARTPLEHSLTAGGGPTSIDAGDWKISASTLLRLPEKLREKQQIFRTTGALHAAGIFTDSGELLHVEEDVGRHNAVDKVIGWAFLERRLPLARHALQVSGRVSFEIVQKAYAAGIPFLSGVSGVSSLAVDLAERAGVTVVGFLRGDSFSAYTHPDRIFVA